MPNWKVLLVQSRYEFKVEEQFARFGIVHYLPKLKEKRRWSDRIKTLEVPAFPNYLFVYNSDGDRNDVFMARGVMHYVRFNNKDATLRPEEMALLKRSRTMIQSGSLQPAGMFRGQAVEVCGGLLCGQRGLLVDWVGKKAVQLKLETISMGFVVELPMDHIRAC
ncbi:MAG: UpxY family transcription antiterminator [Saprospiraceae bacterium]|nr:UpxY family transcription antiterminator [Saprospiraceae bacterium]